MEDHKITSKFVEQLKIEQDLLDDKIHQLEQRIDEIRSILGKFEYSLVDKADNIDEIIFADEYLIVNTSSYFFGQTFSESCYIRYNWLDLTDDELRKMGEEYDKEKREEIKSEEIMKKQKDRFDAILVIKNSMRDYNISLDELRDGPIEEDKEIINR